MWHWVVVVAVLIQYPDGKEGEVSISSKNSYPYYSMCMKKLAPESRDIASIFFSLKDGVRDHPFKIKPLRTSCEQQYVNYREAKYTAD